MGYDIGAGILGGIARGADAYSDAITENQKVKYEDLKSKTLYERQMNLEEQRNKNQVTMAEQKQGYAKENIAAESGARSAYRKEGMELEQGAVQEERYRIAEAIAKRDVTDWASKSEEEKKGILDTIISEQTATSATASQGASDADRIKMRELTMKAWENMSEQEREARVKKAGGDEGKAFRAYDVEQQRLLRKPGQYKYTSAEDKKAKTTQRMAALEADIVKDVSKYNDRESALAFVAKLPEGSSKDLVMREVDRRFPSKEVMKKRSNNYAPITSTIKPGMLSGGVSTL